MDDDRPKLLQGIDVDPEALSDRLHGLADGVETGEIPVTAVSHSEESAVQEDVEVTLSITYKPNEECDESLAIDYDPEFL